MKTFLTVFMAASAMPAAAQWLNYPTPGLPRTVDGKPNLSAPAPRMADGKIAPGKTTAAVPPIPELHVLWITGGLGCDGESIAIAKRLARQGAATTHRRSGSSSTLERASRAGCLIGPAWQN